MQGLPASAFNLTNSQSILNEIGVGQLALDHEIHTSIQEAGAFDESLSLENEHVGTKDGENTISKFTA